MGSPNEGQQMDFGWQDLPPEGRGKLHSDHENSSRQSLPISPARQGSGFLKDELKDAIKFHDRCRRRRRPQNEA